MVEFKIDKRSQIVDYAMEWPTYWTDQGWTGPNHPNRLFNRCFDFANHIYGRQGLTIPGDDGSTMFPAASVPDDGKGSLRFFWSEEDVRWGRVNDPAHVGILGGNNDRIDNNGYPAPNGAAGPTWRSKDAGVGDIPGYVTGPPQYEPRSQTLRGVTNPSLSLLQELDAE